MGQTHIVLVMQKIGYLYGTVGNYNGKMGHCEGTMEYFNVAKEDFGGTRDRKGLPWWYCGVLG